MLHEVLSDISSRAVNNVNNVNNVIRAILEERNEVWEFPGGEIGIGVTRPPHLGPMGLCSLNLKTPPPPS
jgi:hypothetical protein